MFSTGPIIIVDDDQDDHEILESVFQALEVKNEIKFFGNCLDALNFLRTTQEQPFMILTDVNLPIMNGIEMREEICKDEYLKKKSIPFIFLTTSASKHAVTEAYQMQVQGYFQKEDTFHQMQAMMKTIIDYWRLCKHPNAM